ncbi:MULTISPECIES: phage tail assembly chaperone [unclassified Burkholderia]|uniref:phage tail assembly chaperone n=1 Tax=unclassified Burkholderia TaxID=2613784 RepID=UPI000F57DC03|nr:MULTISPECIES: hypothetical protein [unclassified Burkholderia]RQR87727.1 hypothetical protein DIE10_06480 [Burkholderia sp. Bp9011]RQR97070.1 hypothetical protein DIE09_06655 [Burkholderia sp. Bp9010]
MSLEFEVSGQRYRAEKLDAFKQLHVSRKIAPIIPKLLPMFMKFAEQKNALQDDISGMAEAFEPLAQALAEMPDADCEYVFNACLSMVMRNHQGNWASIWTGGSLMFDDIDLGAMVQITSKVIWDSLGAFTRGLLANAKPGSPVA